MAPIACGGLYSWSLLNIETAFKDGLGFPFDNYFAFYFLSLCCYFLSFGTAFLPNYLNHKRTETKPSDCNAEPSDRNLLKISFKAFSLDIL